VTQQLEDWGVELTNPYKFKKYHIEKALIGWIKAGPPKKPLLF